MILIILKNVKLDNEKLKYEKIKIDIEKMEKGFLKAVSSYEKLNLDILSRLLHSSLYVDTFHSYKNKFINKLMGALRAPTKFANLLFALKY